MFGTLREPTPPSGDRIGSTLAAARERRGLPIEQAARDTRIRVSRLKEIESDDLSQFVHPSYARMFLIDYAKYLGVPFSEIRDLLPDRGECGAEGYQYLQNIPERKENPARPNHRREGPRRRLTPVVITVVVIGIGSFVGLQAWSFANKLDRLNLSKTTEVGVDQAEPIAEPEAAKPAEAPAAPAQAGNTAPAVAQPEAAAPSNSDSVMLQPPVGEPASDPSLSSVHLAQPAQEEPASDSNSLLR